jgi:hypothetical protein
MNDRNDGLLRGSRDERCDQMDALRNAEWNLETMLDLYTGLLDHADEVRASASNALKEIAKRNPESITISPLSLLGKYSEDLWFFADFGTPEALSIARQVLTNITNGSNAEFEATLRTIVKDRRLDLLEHVQTLKLSQTKAKILRSVLPPTFSKQTALENSARFQDAAKEVEHGYFDLPKLPGERD